jgi:hypothetical protein
MKAILFILFTTVILNAQTFEIEKINGSVKILTGKDNSWIDLKSKTTVYANTVITTDKNSSVKIKGGDIFFTLKESSAISVSNIKKMSIDDLLLALAMDNVLNTPKKNGNKKSENTSTYGENLSGETLETLKSNSFGIKRLNGAKQLAESGFTESAIVTAKEVYRKYPETKSDIESRLLFANLIYNKGLYEEALDDYSEIKSLKLNSEQKTLVDERIEQINKKLINK